LLEQIGDAFVVAAGAGYHQTIYPFTLHQAPVTGQLLCTRRAGGDQQVQTDI
jgi:hypothetical protein